LRGPGSSLRGRRGGKVDMIHEDFFLKRDFRTKGVDDEGAVTSWKGWSTSRAVKIARVTKK